MKRFLEAVLFISLIFLTSLIWIITQWPYTPEDAIADIGKIGMIGFVFDILFVGLVIRWYKSGKVIEKTFK